MPQPVQIIFGPTASGKSARALERATAENGVIINADAMQLYDALPILTAQPSGADRERVPHCLYSVLKPNESCNAARFRDMALAVIEDVIAAGQTPFIVGGTGFYIKALTEGLSPIPAADDEIRKKAESRYQEMGAHDFHKALTQFDPESAARLHENDRHRLIRAWEVYEQTGKPLSYWQTLPLSGPPAGLTFAYETLTPAMATLENRISRRFDRMIDEGVIEEVQALKDKIAGGQVAPSALVIKAHGFRKLSCYLDGDMSLAEAVAESKQETRQYAKRQMTWIRNQIQFSD